MIIITAKINQAGRPYVIFTKIVANNCELPVVCKALLTGIIAPSKIIIGQSISWYNWRIGKIPVKIQEVVTEVTDKGLGETLN